MATSTYKNEYSQEHEDEYPPESEAAIFQQVTNDAVGKTVTDFCLSATVPTTYICVGIDGWVPTRNPMPTRILGQYQKNETSGTIPSECNQCPLFLTKEEENEDGLYAFDLGMAAFGTGNSYTADFSYTEKWEWLEAQYNGPPTMGWSFDSPRVYQGFSDTYKTIKGRSTGIIEASGDCVCCCCDCAKVGEFAEPKTDADCVAEHGSGWFATVTTYSAGTSCSGSLTWEDTTTCYACEYPS